MTFLTFFLSQKKVTKNAWTANSLRVPVRPPAYRNLGLMKTVIYDHRAPRLYEVNLFLSKKNENCVK